MTILMAWGIHAAIPAPTDQHDETVITQDLDLGGKILYLPEGSVLKFQGGVIKNGTLVGNNTRIDCESVAFDNVTIQGVWNVPAIYSTWFKDLSYDNALRNVFALTNPNIHNKVYVASGEYSVTVSSASESAIVVGDNTEVFLDGCIRLQPNHYSGCNVILISGYDVCIAGSGMIVGDRNLHKGDKGEWGMGIRVSNADNVSITGMTISDCWGDCIYIGEGSKNIVVADCVLDHGRRQGISVVSAVNVTLRDLLIKNINGTAPEYAIDIEPNKGDRIDNVLIENVKAIDCVGGVFSTGYAEGSYIGKITIHNVMIERTTKMPIRLEKCASADISDCTISDYDTHTAIRCNNVDEVLIQRNKIYDINKSQADIDHANEGKRHVQIFNSVNGKSINNKIFN